MRVRDAIRRLPETVDAAMTIKVAARRMDESAVGALIVTDEGRPVGIVTDRDLATRAVARGYPLDGRIDGVMSTGLIGIDADDDLRQAIQLFSHHAIRRLPVVEGDSIRGMITLDDLVIDLAHDLEEATKPLAAQVLFGHPEARPPVPA